MKLRGVISDKQKLIAVLEKAYIKATSEKYFYNQLEQKRLRLYSRNNQIVGVKLKRKYRFKTLGYDKSILQELDKNLSQNKRIKSLRLIRDKQKGRYKEL